MRIITIQFLLFSSFISFAQKDSVGYFFNEIELSANYVTAPNQQRMDNFGIGGGVFHSMFDRKRFNFIFGLEYNLTNQFQYQLSNAGHSDYWTNSIIQSHYISVPLNVRFNIGKRVRFFVQAGIFIDFPLFLRINGTVHLPPDYIQEKKVSYKQQADINYGFSAGLGFQMPIGLYSLLIKMEYKRGINKIIDRYDVYNNYIRLAIGCKINFIKFHLRTKTSTL